MLSAPSRSLPNNNNVQMCYTENDRLFWKQVDMVSTNVQLLMDSDMQDLSWILKCFKVKYEKEFNVVFKIVERKKQFYPMIEWISDSQKGWYGTKLKDSSLPLGGIDLTSELEPL